MRSTDVGTARYTLTLHEHSDSGHLMAVSDQLPGLMVQGRNRAEIRDRAPRVIRRLLEAQGKRIASVRVEPKAPDLPRALVIQRVVTVVAEFDEAA